MKSKQIWMAALLLSGAFYANAQVQTAQETGLGVDNGAVMDPSSSAGNAVYIGYRAGYNTRNTAHGAWNTFVGHESGNANTAGAENTFLGGKTGFSNTTGSNNIFVGMQAGHDNTTGNYNTFTGANAGLRNTTANENTFYGALAGMNNTASNNTFFGSQTGFSNTTGVENVFFGKSSGYYNTTGAYNVFIGNNSGVMNQVGGNNVIIGTNSGYNSISNNNTFLGSEAGFNTSGEGNVFLGRRAGYNETGSNKLYISNSSTSLPLIFGDFTSNHLKFNATVGIGNVSLLTAFPTTASGVNVAKYRLFVTGGILTEEVRVTMATEWADYVFNKDYALRSLKDVEKYIAENGHLPNVPSAEQVKAEGVNLGDMARIQQEKIEELTLYAIQQDKQITEQNKTLEQQQKEIDELKAAVKALMDKQ